MHITSPFMHTGYAHTGLNRNHGWLLSYRKKYDVTFNSLYFYFILKDQMMTISRSFSVFSKRLRGKSGGLLMTHGLGKTKLCYTNLYSFVGFFSSVICDTLDHFTSLNPTKLFLLKPSFKFRW